MKVICIAGKNNIAVDVLLYCLEHYADHKIICIMNKNDSGMNSWQKSLGYFARKNAVEITTLDKVYNIADMLFLSLEFDQLINPERFASKELFNIHFSLLPKYKGMYTSALPILNGELHTGVTLHKIHKGIDTGEIIEQQVVGIELKDTALDVYKKLIRTGTELVVKNLDNLLVGNVCSTPQASVGSTYYSKHAIDYSNVHLDVNQTAYQIANQIRAFAFRPYQFMKWNNSKYVDYAILNEVSEKRPGAILDDNEIFTKIATIDYDLILYKDTLNKLFNAIIEGDNDFAKTLCVSDQIIGAQDSHGWTALTVAVYNNNFEMVQYLINRGADVGVLNNNGTNLLMYAKDCFVRTGDYTVFALLLEMGLQPGAKDYRGKNLYDYCREEKITHIGEFNLF